MRTYNSILTGISAMLLVVLPAAGARAGDNIEAVTGGGTVISHKTWTLGAMPLKWRFNEDGIIDNDTNGNGTPDISNADAVTELTLSFQQWQNVTTSKVTFSYDGESAETDSGCDLINLMTWSDTTQTWPSGVIARGIATSYVGPDVVLNAVNRNSIVCGSGTTTVALDVATYPNGMSLHAGTILDMDMTWNSGEMDYVTVPNTTYKVLDLRAVATHEIGHLIGLSHASLAYAASDPVTMFPIVSSTDVTLQNNMRTLENDDRASASDAYPDVGFWPGGTAPYTTGAIRGRVLQEGGDAASGVRIWAYNAADTTMPVYETFSATEFDWDPALQAGDYLLDGMLPGTYYVCIVPWSNGVPSTTSADPARYNLTTYNGTGNTGFPTECYDDAQSATPAPDFSSGIDRLRKVTVTAGATTPSINFVTGSQKTDFLLVMDRSGSMTSASGTPGVTKIQALQNAANAFINYLDLSGGHRLGLVQFQEVLVPLTPVVDLQPLDAASAIDAHNAIDTMSAGGWTNIIGGVEEGVSQVTGIADPNERQIMLLFTDGQHNRPIGSDLNDINAPLVSNGIRLYSVGFGTDVDDAILSQVALNTGGVHVNEQALDDIALGKHFLAIAASAADETTLIDPTYLLTGGQKASLSVPVLESERDLSFAVQWVTRDRERVSVSVRSPNGCVISGLLATPGVGIRRGDTHRLVKIGLPYDCSGKLDSLGTWVIEVTGSRKIEKNQEQVGVVVFGSSRTQLYAAASMANDRPILVAKVLHEALPIKDAWIKAEVVSPAKPTYDSEKQDGKQDGGRYVPPEPPLAERTVTIELTDDGKNGDAKAGDGLFSANLPVKDPGTYNVHVMARYHDGTLTAGRELLTGFYFDGKSLLLPPKVERPKLKDW